MALKLKNLSDWYNAIHDRDRKLVTKETIRLYESLLSEMRQKLADAGLPKGVQSECGILLAVERLYEMREGTFENSPLSKYLPKGYTTLAQHWDRHRADQKHSGVSVSGWGQFEVWLESVGRQWPGEMDHEAAKAERAENRNVRKPESFYEYKETTVEDRAWVMANLHDDAGVSVGRNDAPTKLAWSMLQQARQDPQFAREIFKSITPKSDKADEQLEYKRVFKDTQIKDSLLAEFGALREDVDGLLSERLSLLG